MCKGSKFWSQNSKLPFMMKLQTDHSMQGTMWNMHLNSEIRLHA